MDTTDQRTDSAFFRENKFDSQFLRQVLTKVVIQEIPSGLYLSEGDFLTPDIENARPFDSCLAALGEATNLKLQSVQLVVNRELNEWGICQSGTGVISQRTQSVRRWCGLRLDATRYDG